MNTQAVNLRKSAQIINRLHSEVQALEETQREIAETKREKAMRIGQEFIKVKEVKKHGEFLPWLAKECPDISERTAQQYMRFARGEATDLSSGSTSADRKSESDSDLPDDEEAPGYTKKVRSGKPPDWRPYMSKVVENLLRAVSALKANPAKKDDLIEGLEDLIDKLQTILEQVKKVNK
jgi:hypothetical protein